MLQAHKREFDELSPVGKRSRAPGHLAFDEIVPLCASPVGGVVGSPLRFQSCAQAAQASADQLALSPLAARFAEPAAAAAVAQQSLLGFSFDNHFEETPRRRHRIARQLEPGSLSGLQEQLQRRHEHQTAAAAAAAAGTVSAAAPGESSDSAAAAAAAIAAEPQPGSLLATIEATSALVPPVSADNPFPASGHTQPTDLELSSNMSRKQQRLAAEASSNAEKLYSLDDLRTIVARALETHENKLREQYGILLSQRIQEMYESFVRYNEDSTSRQLQESSFDYMN